VEWREGVEENKRLNLGKDVDSEGFKLTKPLVWLVQSLRYKTMIFTSLDAYMNCL
jgi:hypothetical protein